VLRVAPLAVLACVLGCTPNIRTVRMTEPYPPRPASAEIGVWSVDLPGCPFEELGLVTATEDLFSHDGQFLDALKDEAREMGGDALIGLRDFYKPDGGDASWALSATVVRFTDADCAPGRGQEGLGGRRIGSGT